ncbi:MAG: hypothetical protein IJ364_03725, partial [Oscillospiraceae bacterium]|nr:hypothetical protein [Oscillospiraceae bacterium]
MKKIVTALLLALLMVFSMAGAAFADITYASPGDVEAGTSLRHLLATVASGSTVSANDSSLPYGCYVETEETENGLNVYLSGTPSVAGSYNCVIDFGNSNSLVCPLNVLAAKPSIVVSPDVTCFPNDYIELFVNASAAGSGNLSYQWYVSSSDTNAGGQLIGGAVNSSYVANTANLGSNYYYCVVTNTSGSQTRSTVSDTIEVRVEQQQASAIHINTLPTRIEYMEGDTLDTAGLSIRVDYADGSSTVLTNGFNVY